MSLFHGKNTPKDEESYSNEFTLFPFITGDEGVDTAKLKATSLNADTNTSVTAEKQAAQAKKKPSSTEEILTEIGSISPLKALKLSVKQTVEEGRLEEIENNKAEPVLNATNLADDKNLKITAKETESATKTTDKPVKKTSSLLAKCMPYIYDDRGNSYVEEKPDYTLESVEDIIESAEKRADEKIARMYNLKTSEIQRIGNSDIAEELAATEEIKPKLRLQETSVKKPLKIGDVSMSSSKMFDTVSIPKVSSTLFDDFSGRRTDVTDGDNVTSPYSREGGMDSYDEGHTRIIPDLKPENDSEALYEDILSHTRPVNVVDISSSSKKTPINIPGFAEEESTVEVDDFKGEKDINRVGSMLKKNVFTTRLRLMANLFLTAMATAIYLPYIKNEVNPIVLGIVAIVAFGFAMLVNFNIFGGFKSAFTRKSQIELPLAIAGILTTAYFLYSIIIGEYPYEPAILPLMSLLAYNWCSYRKAAVIFENFKLVASRKNKRALSLIDDVSVTSAMARSVINGEILAAGEQETEEIDDFLKNTLSGYPFAQRLNVFTIVSIVAAIIIGLTIGVSSASFTSALLAAATVLCISTAPSLFIADMLPFAAFSEKLHHLKAAVCSKYSAEKIEQINAVVLSSSEIFPSGCIKLYNMMPLSANHLDETITLAASVAKAAESPLSPMLCTILTDDTVLPEADSIKYEDSLGVSGWVGNNHIMIGNRSLMEAHGVRVPALEVDRKILRRGYFPVYVACDQRACALLMIGYSVDRRIGSELGKLNDRGVTLLIRNCDPNITEQMLCDYYALYPDLVKILDHNGADKYKKETAPVEHISAHGFHRGDVLSFLTMITGSMKMRTVSNVLYILHIIATVITWLLFAGISLGGTLGIMGAGLCALCELACVVISLTIYFVSK